MLAMGVESIGSNIQESLMTMFRASCSIASMNVIATCGLLRRFHQVLLVRSPVRTTYPALLYHTFSQKKRTAPPHPIKPFAPCMTKTTPAVLISHSGRSRNNKQSPSQVRTVKPYLTNDHHILVFFPAGFKAIASQSYTHMPSVL